MRKTILVLALFATAGIAVAQRMPTVNFSVSGAPGAWDLNFSVTNNLMSGEGRVYFFGVLLDTGRNIQGSPANWDPNAWPSWDNSPYGGSNTIYNNNWINLNFNNTDIAEGATQSGFIARHTGQQAPSQVRFFAYAYGGTYGGNDHFNADWNPGWEGTAVPEPATMLILAAGAAAVAARRRRK